MRLGVTAGARASKLPLQEAQSRSAVTRRPIGVATSNHMAYAPHARTPRPPGLPRCAAGATAWVHAMRQVSTGRACPAHLHAMPCTPRSAARNAMPRHAVPCHATAAPGGTQRASTRPKAPGSPAAAGDAAPQRRGRPAAAAPGVGGWGGLTPQLPKKMGIKDYPRGLPSYYIILYYH